jgi:hypothetical protein
MADIVTLSPSSPTVEEEVPLVDPTLPTAIVLVIIDGEKRNIKLCLDFGILMDTESKLIAAGHESASLMQSIRPQYASEARIFFAIASQPFQPKLGYEAALKLVTLLNIVAVTDAITKMWSEAFPRPKGGEGALLDPPAPNGDSGESNIGNGSSQPPVQASESDSSNSAS